MKTALTALLYAGALIGLGLTWTLVGFGYDDLSAGVAITALILVLTASRLRRGVSPLARTSARAWPRL